MRDIAFSIHKERVPTDQIRSSVFSLGILNNRLNADYGIKSCMAKLRHTAGGAQTFFESALSQGLLYRLIFIRY